MAECDKHKLLEQISQCEFILIDINLYLDTHPNDKRALADYNSYADQLEVLKHKYVKMYGPLQNFGNSTVCSDDCFIWVTQPFPWDREM